MKVSSFYESLYHMVITCKTPTRDLTNIDENNSVYPLNPSNFTNYNSIYNLMTGAIYHKINNTNLWTGYGQGWKQVQSNLLEYDGFDVMYAIFSNILPKLNINSEKASSIDRPVYNNAEYDNMYAYIDTCNSFLNFEKLRTNSSI